MNYMPAKNKNIRFIIYLLEAIVIIACFLKTSGVYRENLDLKKDISVLEEEKIQLESNINEKDNELKQLNDDIASFDDGKYREYDIWKARLENLKNITGR